MIDRQITGNKSLNILIMINYMPSKKWLPGKMSYVAYYSEILL